MTKKRHPMVDVRIEQLHYPDRATGHVLAPLAADPVGEMLEIEPNHDHRAPLAAMQMKGGLPGQVWRARVKRSHGGAKVVEPQELIRRAPIERDPACPHASVCGGCNYQTLAYETELLLKAQQMRALYAEFPALRDVEIRRSPATEHYRNKMEYTFGDETPGGPLTLGLHQPRHFYNIIPTPHCRIVPEDFNRLRDAVETYCHRKGWAAYHRTRKTGFLRHLVLRVALTTGALMVNLVTTSAHTFTPDERREFCERLTALPLDLPLVSIFHTTNDADADAVIPEKLDLWYGRNEMDETLFDLTFHVGPFSFFQPNVYGAQNLYAKAIALAGDMSGQTVYDLYCGTGTLAQIIARHAQRVIGVEIVEEAVEKARQAAFENHLPNVKFIAADVLDELQRLADAGERPDVVFLDPPRQGVHPKAIAQLIAAAPRKIVYISCNPTTQVQDLTLFRAGGYAVQAGMAFDQFPRTKHVETVVLLSRENK
ncbi:MAG: 23S rRNA (uracil(1939)-C(5))-methyltransferase RlmD [Peptoniphilaceae bacterium]|nr:23S rRNA (uracil(1939)-C(5))-methyltransferase RlmD [Peptoniphilaceae bacterium]MDY6085695.1 23S rRNA (uracil(1939)-C(5))-methyltransferase RlmD [Peptoniphilaceae bacterium]